MHAQPSSDWRGGGAAASRVGPTPACAPKPVPIPPRLPDSGGKRGFVDGMLVRHANYGNGRIVEVSGQGALRRVKIRFAHGRRTDVYRRQGDSGGPAQDLVHVRRAHYQPHRREPNAQPFRSRANLGKHRTSLLTCRPLISLGEAERRRFSVHLSVSLVDKEGSVTGTKSIRGRMRRCASMGNTTRLGSFLLLGLFAPAVLLAAPAPGPIPVAALATVVPLPAGIADPSGRTGYFASADGGIEAIELATGKVMWATHEAHRPLFVDGDHLLVQAGVKRNRLRILRLNLSRNGECDLESDPVVFPAWVVTGEAAGCSFFATLAIGETSAGVGVGSQFLVRREHPAHTGPGKSARNTRMGSPSSICGPARSRSVPPRRRWRNRFRPFRSTWKQNRCAGGDSSRRTGKCSLWKKRTDNSNSRLTRGIDTTKRHRSRRCCSRANGSWCA